MREHGVWTYAVVNLTHILGVASLFGAVLVLDLRLLGFWRYIPLTAITGPVVPIAATGFPNPATSGTSLPATNGTQHVDNPFIYIKFPAIALRSLKVLTHHFLPPWKPQRTRLLRSSEQS